jgi:Zeta toxin
MARRFEDYEDEVRRYGWSWFQNDAQALTLVLSKPQVRRRVYQLAAGHETVGTEVLYRPGDRWVDQRLTLHERLVAETLAATGIDPPDDGEARPPVRHAVLLLGLPGSGKSSQLRPVAHALIRRVSPTPGLTVDADVVRELLPEYAGGLGSEVVQEETSKIANGLLFDEAVGHQAHLILDKVGHPQGTVATVDYLVETGWSVWCLCARVEMDIALARARQRALETGRYVPEAYIRDVGTRPIEAYEAVSRGRVIIGGALLDTNEPGRPPTVVDADPETLFGRPGEVVSLWRDTAETVGNPGDAR